jgi:hypothetical protein
LGRESMARLATWYILLQIYIKTHRNLHIAHVYGLRTLTESPSKHCETHTKLKRATPKSWPAHGGTIPAQYRIYKSSREGMAPNDKAGRTLATARFPIGHNDSLSSPSQNHAFCWIFYPCILLLQRILTHKTCHALSSSGIKGSR